MLRLRRVPKSDSLLRTLMPLHYSKPKRFVARTLCYQVVYGEEIYGMIVAGSATKYLPGRNDFFGGPFRI